MKTIFTAKYYILPQSNIQTEEWVKYECTENLNEACQKVVAMNNGVIGLVITYAENGGRGEAKPFFTFPDYTVEEYRNSISQWIEDFKNS